MLMCKSFGRFKSNVRNKVSHEDCIVEGYISTELVTFCSTYLSSTPIVHNRPQRNADGCRGAKTRVNVDRITMIQIHRYIMFNFDDFHQLRM
jgi:hypothetical protein